MENSSSAVEVHKDVCFHFGVQMSEVCQWKMTATEFVK